MGGLTQNLGLLSTAIKATSSLNVGIGTSSPSALLHLSQNTSNLNLYLQNTNGSGKTWSLNSDNAGKFNIHDTTANYFTINSAGVVGIGTTSPRLAGSGYSGMEISSSTNGSSILLSNSTSNITYIYTGASGGDFLIENAGAQIFRAGSSERMRITASGNLGVGAIPAFNTRMRIRGADQSSSNYTFICDNAVTDTFIIRNDGYINLGNASSSPYNNTYGNAANTFLSSDGSIGRSTSSLKYKTDVQDYNKGLAEVLKIRPVYYKSKNEREAGMQFAGLISEEVHELGLTEFVQYAEDGTPDALAYQNMIALAFKAIQELKAEIDELKNK